MDWVEAIGESIQYIEEHILEELRVEKIAEHVHLSPFYYQKGVSMMCGYSVAEYIRNRRLSLAGAEIVSSDGKILDIALKYGYDSPDGFTKTFTRFPVSRSSSVCSSENQFPDLHGVAAVFS